MVSLTAPANPIDGASGITYSSEGYYDSFGNFTPFRTNMIAPTYAQSTADGIFRNANRAAILAGTIVSPYADPNNNMQYMIPNLTIDPTKNTQVNNPSAISVVQTNKVNPTPGITNTNTLYMQAPQSSLDGNNNQSPTSATNVANGSTPSMINNLIDTLKGGTIFGIPDWMLLIGAVGGLVLFSGGRGRR